MLPWRAAGSAPVGQIPTSDQLVLEMPERGQRDWSAVVLARDAAPCRSCRCHGHKLGGRFMAISAESSNADCERLSIFPSVVATGVTVDVPQSAPFDLGPDVSASLRTLVRASGQLNPGAALPALFAVFVAIMHRYGGYDGLDEFVVALDPPTDVAEPAMRSVRVEDAPFAEFVHRACFRMDGDSGSSPTVPTGVDVPRFRPRTSAGIAEAEIAAVTDGLTFEVVDDGNRAITGEFQSSGNRWPGWATQDAVALLTDLVRAGCGDPAALVSDLLSAAIGRIRSHVKDVGTPTPLVAFHKLVEERADGSPGSVAIRDERGVLTYGQVERRANQLAHLLRDLGAGPETVVGVRVGRNARTPVAFLAVLKTGAAYVPVDGLDPRERRAAVLSDAQVLVEIVCDDTLGASDDVVPALVLDADWNLLVGRPANRPTEITPTSRAAYILYTSGTTGTPKGVVIEHGQLSHYLHAIIERLDMDSDMRWLVVQSLAVDSSVTAVMPALSLGGEVHIVAQKRVVDPAGLTDWIRNYRIDAMKIAPSHLRSLQASAPDAQLIPRRRLVIGCEASDWRWLLELQRASPGCRVVNHYGPTETTVGVLTLAVADHMDEEWDVSPIGYPLAGVQVSILDRAGHPLPDGAVGELTVAGPTVGRGYHRRRDLTASSFGTVPTDPGGRLYHTGDFARRRPDGLVEFLGRRDDQVKIRGYRVALGEIDAVLRSHGEVANAVTVVRKDTRGDSRLVAYVQPRNPARTAVDLGDYVHDRLPAHMIPREMVMLAELPLAANGKIALGALPMSVTESPPSTEIAGSDGAGNALQQLVMDVWRELLGSGATDPDQNFFDAGGHSLLLVQLQQNLEGRSGRIVPLLDLFRHTTIRAQAALLSPSGEGSSDAPSRSTLDTTAAQQVLNRRRNEQAKARRAGQ